MQKNTESIDPKVYATSNGKTKYYQSVLYAVLKNQNLLKNKKQGLLSNLGIRTPLHKIPLLGNVLF